MAHHVGNVQGGGDSPEDLRRQLHKAFGDDKADASEKVQKVLSLLPKYFQDSFPRDEMDDKFKPLTFWAARYGLLEVLKELVETYHCDLKYVDARTGQDLLYTACAKGFVGVVQYLASEHKFNPSEPRGKMTPLHASCQKGQLDMVKLLTEKLNCDPKAPDPDGNSLVHAACINGHLELARYVIENHKLNTESRNKKEETPLHLAAASGHLSIVEYLLQELGCKLSVFDASGLTPLHNACRNGRVDVVKCILENLEADNTSPFDNSGCNPLHLACRSGRSEVVRVLLASGKVDPNAPTCLDQAPIEIARDDKTIKELIKWGAKPVGRTRSVLVQYRDRMPLKSLVYIYVVGYEMSGKTTLVESLQQPISTKAKFLQYAGFHSSKVKDVTERTAGIVPIEYDSHDFGKVLLFDFAGQHQFHASHEALLEYSNTSSAPIFLLVVDASQEFEEVKRKVNYWVSFIMRNPVSGNIEPHVVVIASHVDELAKKISNHKEVLMALEKHARRKLDKAKLPCKGFFSLDCRNPLKQEALRQCLKTSCQLLRTPDEDLDVCCHVLRVFLLDKFRDVLCCKIKDVISKARDSEYPLPIQADRLCELAEAMTTRTKTLFLPNHYHIEESWIVLDIDTLLQEVNGSIFAPESFKNKLSTTLQGVLRKSQLREHFPDLDPDMLVAFLRRLDFCQLVDDQEVLKNVQDDDIEEDGIPHYYHDTSTDGPNSTLASAGPDKTKSRLPSDFSNHLFNYTPPTKVYLPPSSASQKPPHPFEMSVDPTHEGTPHEGTPHQGTPHQGTPHLRTPDSYPPTELTVGNSTECNRVNGSLPTLDRIHSVPAEFKSPTSSLPTEVKFSSSLPDVMHPVPLRSQSPASMGCGSGRPSPTPSQEFLRSRHSSGDSLLFFPGLIQKNEPGIPLWKVDKSFKYHIGWCLECTNYEHTFGKRFLTTLHLRLESRFAVKTSNSLYAGAECTIWKNGIHWLDMDGIETIVEMVEDGKAVLLLMRMKEGMDTLMKGLRLRSKVIRKILKTKELYCSKVLTVEYLIDKDHLQPDHEYPVIRREVGLKNLKRYNVELIAQAFVQKSKYVIERNRSDLVPLKDVIVFDPYMELGGDIIKKIYAVDKQQQHVEQELLFELGKCHREHTEQFSKMLVNSAKDVMNVTDSDTCLDVLMRYRQFDHTLDKFRKQLDRYSLFAGRDVFKMSMGHPK